jgi:16S rRNA (uracil1498-N3)-methyltransferase
VDRWQRIALEATKQCGRAVLMDIAQPISFDEALKLTDSKILFSERNGQEFASFDGSKEITALVGPEGGWSDAELFTADAAGVAIVTLGGRILRAETASIAIAAILQHRFGDLN